MSKLYEPNSDFLRHFVDGNVSLSDDDFGHENLRLLLNEMNSENVVDRDWAVLLLSQSDLDNDKIRDALKRAAHDPDQNVRAEAILGLARRSSQEALPYIKSVLQSDVVEAPIFEACQIVADPSLVILLRDFLEPSGDKFLDGLVEDAYVACINGKALRSE